MKHIKRLVVFVLLFVIVLSPIHTGFSFERKQHDKYMEEVLFKNFKEIQNDNDANRCFKAIGCAAYLTIDQFNDNGQKDLDYLVNEMKIKGLPSNVSEISFNASGTTHRTYTHRGWDFQYVGEMKELWMERKVVLITTVDSLFDFEGNTNKRDSFCALIYYIHILGDHMDDTSYYVKNGLKMDVGGRVDEESIIDELQHHIGILFADQKYTHKYRSLTTTLEKYDNRFGELVRSEGGINSDEKFQEKQELTEDLMKILTMYIPEMLKEEQFFYERFY
ncbi:MAG: hypothetical protein PUC73_07020 [Lachnospiraceae bacterium]|nr:hypothetical protein [Lachnospiraceae bacterium]